MTSLDRLFLVLTAVALLLFAGLLLATMMGKEILVDWLLSSDLLLDGGLVVIITVLLAIYLLILATRYEKQKFVVHRGELGEVRLSVSCVRDLIEEAAHELPGIKQADAVVTDLENIKVKLSIEVFPDNNIPQLSEELQKSVKNYLEEVAGVPVETIEVFVKGISENNARLA